MVMTTKYTAIRRCNIDQGIAQMLHDTSRLDTPATKRASKQILVKAPSSYRSHVWFRGSWTVDPPRPHDPFFRDEYWYYSNDGTVSQAKAYIWYDHQVECYRGSVRRADIPSPLGTLTGVMEYLASCVKDLLALNYNFYAPK